MASHAAMLLDPKSYQQQMKKANGTRQQQTKNPAGGSSTASTAAPTGTSSMAHQLLNPRSVSSTPKSKRTSSPRPGPSPTASVSGNNLPLAHRPSLSQQDVSFQFVNGDDTPDLSDDQMAAKRPREEEGLLDVANRRNLIEDIYGVERREDQPQKRIKKVDNDEKAITTPKTSQFDVSNHTGLAEYMKQAGKESAGGSTSQIVDLTSESVSKSTLNTDEDDLQFTGSNDLRTQKVCYGKVEGAMVQAHIVPKPSSGNPFGDSNVWPSMKLGIRHDPNQGNRIDVADPHGIFFGTVEAKTASAIVPVLDSKALKTELTARLDVRRKEADEVPWQHCSSALRASLNLYGLRKDADMVGKFMGQNNVWLGTPSMVEQGVPVFNPHAERRRTQPMLGSSAAATPRSRNNVSYEVRTAEEVNDAVMKMFDQLKSADNIPEVKPSPSILTPLLRHQKQALWFMMEKEQPRKFGPNEEDNNSLWRIEYSRNGRRYREIISGTILKDEPPQTLGGLLADMMGLGKTLSILSLVVATLPQSREWEESMPHPDLVRDLPGIRNTRTTLLVSPLSAVNNWVSQIKEHLKKKTISYYVFHGPSRTTNVDELAEYDLVITTYSTILSELTGRGSKRGISPLIKMNMFRIVLDEAHTIREQSAAQTQAIFRLNGERRWSVTGTPVQNRLEDLASVTKFLRLYPYDEKAKFSQYILSRFRIGDASVLASLRVLVDSITLRRVKDKIDLPPKQDKIIMLDFCEKEAQLHEFFRKESNVMMKVIASESKTTMGGRMYHHVLKAMMILRQISAHGKELLDKADRERIKGMSVHDAIDLEEGEDSQSGAIDKKAYEMFSLMRESSADVCARCGRQLVAKTNDSAEDPTTPIAVMLPCFDVLCPDCFQPAQAAYDQVGASSQQTKCLICEGWIPMMYSAITPAGFDEYMESQAEAKHSRKRAKSLGEYEGPHTKTQALISYLQTAAEESAVLKADEPPIKSVVFSTWTSHLDLIEIALKDNHLTGYTRLDGSMSLAARNRALESFRDDDSVTILLATIGAGGVGLNLTSASRVYVMEPQYNPAAVAQAVDRVHRLGQTRDVTTIQFIMKNSIEEKIFELAKRKQQLADMSMNRGKLDGEKQEARMKEYRSLFK